MLMCSFAFHICNDDHFNLCRRQVILHNQTNFFYQSFNKFGDMLVNIFSLFHLIFPVAVNSSMRVICKWFTILKTEFHRILRNSLLTKTQHCCKSTYSCSCPLLCKVVTYKLILSANMKNAKKSRNKYNIHNFFNC